MSDPNMPPPPPSAPPPGQGWQSQPTPPGPPPAGGGMGGGMPSWTSNITARGTMAGPAGLALADIPDRLIATFVDFLIIGVIGFIVNTISTSILGDNFLGIFGLNTVKVPSLLSSLVTVVVVGVISAAYFIYQWSRMGGVTVGSRLTKVRVADAMSGGPISQGQAINRWLVLGLPQAVGYFYGWGIGIIIGLVVVVWYIYLIYTIAQSPTRQGFHDVYAKTVVAKAM